MHDHHCADCGKPNDPRSTRCRKCEGLRKKRLAIAECFPEDIAILKELHDEGLNGNSFARRRGISRGGAYRRIYRARSRASTLMGLSN